MALLFGNSSSLLLLPSLPLPFLLYKSKPKSDSSPFLHVPGCLSLETSSLPSTMILRRSHCATMDAVQKYTYPDPNPDFAEKESERFRDELKKKLVKSSETFGDELDNVIDICSKIFEQFLSTEYGGPGTLLVEPFTDMLLALKERKLPGAPIAARSALLWAQNYVDRDWIEWMSQSHG